MPLYEYECTNCNLIIKEIRKISERDDLAQMAIKYCPIRKKNMEEQLQNVEKTHSIWGGMFITDIFSGESKDINCKLKRKQSSGSFKI